MKTLLMALLVAAATPAPASEPVTVAQRQEADGSHTLVHEVVVNAPVGEVWAAISSADGWKTWAAPVAWVPEGAPDVIETSYSPDARPGDPSTIKQQIVARIPGRLMVFRTVKAPAAFPDLDTYSKVTSLFELEAAGEGRTRVRLTGTGYADTPAGRRLLGFFEKGNSTSLQWLRTRMEQGPTDWRKRMSGGK